MELENCCGCGACAAACPEKTIRMERNAQGFQVPVRTSACRNCGECRQVCPAVCRVPADGKESFLRKYYAFRAPDPMRLESTSGGLFQMLARSVLQEGGVVFGAAFDGQQDVRYACAENEAELPALLKTKYVQADPEGLYRNVAGQLQAGKKVLFSGTPCTAEALLLFLRSAGVEDAADCLITADLVCSGVSAPGVWEAYLGLLAENGKISGFEFRAKDRPDGGHTAAWVRDGSRTAEGFLENPWCRIYAKRIGLRESCYHCRWADPARASDITMGDFWGIEKALPGFDDGYGVSLAVLHTEKGLKAFQRMLETFPDCTAAEVREEDALQARLREPPGRPPLQRLWKKDLENGKLQTGLKEMLRKYGM